MLKFILPAVSRRPDAPRRARRLAPLMEGLETRQVQSSLSLMSYDPVITDTNTSTMAFAPLVTGATPRPTRDFNS